MAPQLPNGLYDLIEHVELNKSGWWEAALNNVLLAVTWIQGRPVHRMEVRDLIISAFSLDIPEDRIAVHIERLVELGSLRVSDDDHVVPANGVSDQMEARLQAAQNNEDIVRAIFVEKVGHCCDPHPPEYAWRLFNERFLLPLVEVLGARTIQLIGGGKNSDGDVAALTNEFVRLFDDDDRSALRSAIGSFLDPGDANVRQYVTEYVEASFLVKASGLTEEAIAGISSFGRRPPTFRLFLDSNFLFSLLNLHENPSNEASQVLGRIIQQVGKHLSIRMYVIAPTVVEIKRTLLAIQAELRGMRMSAVLADAAIQVGSSGIVARYAQVNKEAPVPISPQEYFRPYIMDLTPILRSNGVEVYNEQTDMYRQRENVINDLHEIMGFEGNSEVERQRRYNAALHDSILWHFVYDKRPAVFESPLEAGSWVVTNDYRLMSFDRRRRRAANMATGVCIHPAELAQILRLWEPRSTDMEQALLSALRLPLMFYQFDSGQEAVSLRILKSLSRFENIDDLGPEAIRDIVLSDAVRSRTVEAISEEEEIQVIRDEILAERDATIAQRDAASNRAKRIEESLAEERAAALDRVAIQKNQQAQVENHNLELAAQVRAGEEQARQVSERIMALEAALSSRDRGSLTRSARIRFAWTRGIGVALMAILIAGLSYGWITLTETPLWIAATASFLVWAICSPLMFAVLVQGDDVRTWPPIRGLLAARRRTFAALAALLLAIAGIAVWQEVIQPLWTR